MRQLAGFMVSALVALRIVHGLPAGGFPDPAPDAQFRLRGTHQRGDFGPLKFRPDGTFHISIFEDLHFGENAWEDWGPRQDHQSVAVMETVLDAEPQTDLVVLNGDLITGENTFLENSTAYVDQLVQPLVRRNLTWASAYGNHDNDLNISAAHILARERRWPNSRTTQMLPDPDLGISNYYLPVYPATCPSPPSPCHPQLLLWFFDSRGGFHFQQHDPSTNQPLPLPNWVDARVAEWFSTTHSLLAFPDNDSNSTPIPIPSLAFVHIPTTASRALQTLGIDPHRQPGIDDDKDLSHQAQGWCPDGTPDGTRCDYGGQDMPFMRAVAGAKGLLALFSGHDHGETWCHTWNGSLRGVEDVEGSRTHLCFGQHSGYGGYGSWVRGARQVGVSLEGLGKGEVDTWVRLENGRVVGRVRLNGTYGRDVYPATPDERTRLPPRGDS
ncbi:hypothetical protein C8A05DRAFT_34959 [Staphylotrichum tortipilum]|uniref:Calcineurin-like phosphoesterase domain-containing protein n=1 Tax=Staphylotrichum tortipilum TaxID=2831512 RepID=A0AAN6RSN9_9PEZI|nr:hypothetical protein C8A05DRAFT_34959 [Staphylotrichum longicolle]